MGSIVLTVAQITGSLIVLGLVGQLNRLAVVVVNSAISLLLVFISRRSLLLTLRDAVKSVPWAVRTILERPAILVTLGVLLLAMLLMLWLGIILPPTDWDGLAQNLPMAAFHIRAGDIQRIDTPYRGIQAYPQGGALLLAYAMLLAGNDTFVDLVQFPFWLLGTLAAFALAREFGASRSSSFLGALLFASAPVTLLQARSAYFDLELAALALASLALIFDRRLRVLPRALGAGAGAGLVLGLKYAGLIYALVLLALLAVLLISERVPGSRLLACLGGYTAICLALGGFWYISNAIQFGNPLWPMQVQLGPRTLLPGVWTTSTFYEGAMPSLISDLPYFSRLVTLWREPTARYAVDMRLGGLGPLWFAAGLPGLLLFVTRAIWHPSLRRWGILSFILVIFLLTPANWHARYVLAVVGAAGTCVAVMLDQVGRTSRQVLSSVIAALACITLIMVPAHGEVSPVDVVRHMQLPLSLRRTVLMEQVPAMDEALRWSELNIPTGSTIAYGWGGVILYPLFGDSLQNELVYAGSSPCADGTAQARGASFFIVRKGSSEEASLRQDGCLREVFASDRYSVFGVKSLE